MPKTNPHSPLATPADALNDALLMAGVAARSRTFDNLVIEWMEAPAEREAIKARLRIEGREQMMSWGISREAIDALAEADSPLPFALPAVLGRHESADQWMESLEPRNPRQGVAQDRFSLRERLKTAGEKVHALVLATQDAAFKASAESAFNQSPALLAKMAQSALEGLRWLLTPGAGSSGIGRVNNYGAGAPVVSFLCGQSSGSASVADPRGEGDLIWGLSADDADFVRQEAQGLARFMPAALGAFWTERAVSATAVKDLKESIAHRFCLPLASVPEGASLRDELPEWTPAWSLPETAEPGAKKEPRAGAKRALSSKIKSDALKEGALGELAVAAAAAYGLSAPNGIALIGEARKALIAEGGWTPATWKLAAASPELAKSCAAIVAAQAAATAKNQSGRDAKIKRLAKDAKNISQRSETLQDNGSEARAWADELFNRRNAERSSRLTRGLSTLMRGAAERGVHNQPEKIKDLEEFAAWMAYKKPAKDPHAWLTPADPNADHGRERAIVCAWLGGVAQRTGRLSLDFNGSVTPQELAQWADVAEALGARSAQWAGVLLDGYAETKKARAAPQEDTLVAFRAQVHDLADFINKQDGFFAALPQKIAWAGLMRQKERWHEELARDAQRTTVRGALSWTSGAVDWSEGEFEAKVLPDSEALSKEGAAMHHCVGSYTETCFRGESRVVSIRWRGARAATLQMEPCSASGGAMLLRADGSNAEQVASWRITQNRGVCNAMLKDQELIDFCADFVARQPLLMKAAQAARSPDTDKTIAAASEISATAPGALADQGIGGAEGALRRRNAQRAAPGGPAEPAAERFGAPRL